MLTQHEVVSYLLERKLISTESIVGSDLLVADVSRRNRNFKVISDRGPCYLLKQGVGVDGVATVAHEALVYQHLQTVAESDQFSGYLPRYYEYDPKEQILILEMLRSAQDLREYQARRRYFSTLLAAALGNALGTLHRLTKVQGAQDKNKAMPVQPPWILSIHRPSIEALRDLSGANVQLIKTLQYSTELCQILDALREAWKPSAIVHQDIKWDNCLVFARPGSKRKTRLKLVDWELASLGDPCWDVGSVFNDYLSFWLFSMPITGESPPNRFMELSRYPLENMQPAIRSFWKAYVQRMGLDAATAYLWLLSAVRYAAAKMIQTGFEHMQRSVQLTSNVVSLLQLSLNVVQRPQEALVHLLGIPIR